MEQSFVLNMLHFIIYSNLASEPSCWCHMACCHGRYSIFMFHVQNRGAYEVMWYCRVSLARNTIHYIWFLNWAVIIAYSETHYCQIFHNPDIKLQWSLMGLRNCDLGSPGQMTQNNVCHAIQRTFVKIPLPPPPPDQSVAAAHTCNPSTKGQTWVVSGAPWPAVLEDLVSNAFTDRPVSKIRWWAIEMADLNFWPPHTCEHMNSIYIFQRIF